MHILKYQPEKDQWEAYADGDFCFHISCGDCFTIKINKRMMPARIELDDDWYVFIGGLRFRLHHGEEYEAQMIW